MVGNDNVIDRCQICGDALNLCCYSYDALNSLFECGMPLLPIMLHWRHATGNAYVKYMPACPCMCQVYARICPHMRAKPVLPNRKEEKDFCSAAP